MMSGYNHGLKVGWLIKQITSTIEKLIDCLSLYLVQKRYEYRKTIVRDIVFNCP